MWGLGTTAVAVIVLQILLAVTNIRGALKAEEVVRLEAHHGCKRDSWVLVFPLGRSSFAERQSTGLCFCFSDSFCDVQPGRSV